MFSDESAGNLGGRTSGRTYVTRRFGQEYLEECIYPKISKIPTQIIWGSIKGGIKGPLIFWKKDWGNITSKTYVEKIIKPHAYPFW